MVRSGQSVEHAAGEYGGKPPAREWLRMSTVPMARFAKPSSRTSTGDSPLSRPRMTWAVYCGWRTCRTPAENERAPTAQKANHLPTSGINAEPAKAASMAIESNGNATISVPTTA
jgi:hypothetical protein